MRILVACEESQAVTVELRNLGHEAYSCDVEACSGGHPEWHLQVDVLELLKMHWDMIIAFPPCTYLTAAGAVRLFNHDGSIKDHERWEKGKKAAEFFKAFLFTDCERVAIENPTMLKIFGLPKYTQAVEPYMFGDPWKKRTCLWLKGLPPLLPTYWVEPKELWVGSTSANRDPQIYTKYKLKSSRDPKVRAKTFPGIAKAMAEQWAGNGQ
ncbi:MAG: DNA cytosine methyltransferase [Lachnospiraceae bacterium]|nr:DNA cytosine methyltransferase [Lachnospiraceae bacterium]